MARKGAKRKEDPGRRPVATVAPAVGAPPAGGLETGLLATLALDAALGLQMLYIHARLAATHGAYTSFCNVSTRVNCDAVMTSAYSSLLGVPIAAWSLASYGLLAALVFWRRRLAGPARDRATLALVGLAAWGLAFSLYMACVAAFAVGAFCLLCAGMYVLNAAIAVLAWRLARGEQRTEGPLLGARPLAIGAGVIALALAAIGAGQLAASSRAAASLSPEQIQQKDPGFYEWYRGLRVLADVPQGEHTRGAADAPLTIVEFSDFECVYCAKAFRDLRALERQHPGSVRVAFHHFPLDSECNPNVAGRMHRSACLAAIAAECAARFGRFWEYHDRLFAAQDRLGRDDLVRTAVELGIDRESFTACLDDPATRARVVDDTAAGARLGVKSTPTLFMNGRSIEGALESGAYEYVLAMERRS